jgi:hypothetical protein
MNKRGLVHYMFASQLGGPAWPACRWGVSSLPNTAEKQKVVIHGY